MQKALTGPKHSLTFRNKYLVVVLSVAAFILSSVSSFGQGAAPPGYAPKVQSYGNWYNRLRADSAQHIPNKACLCKNDNDTTPQLFIYMDTLRGFWNGAFHNIGFGGGSSGTDTIYVTQIGTGSPQIPLVYAVNGNLRVARLVPGVFTTPFMNADSAAGVNVDTTGSAGVAYKAWIIAQYGPPMGGSGTNIFNSDGTLTSSPRTLTGLGQTLKFNDIDFRISTNNQKHVWITDSVNNTQMYMGPGCCFGTGLQRGSTIISQSLTSSVPFFTIAMDSGFSSINDQFGNNITLAGPTEGTPGIIMAPAGGNLTIYSIPSTTDTTKKSLVYDPITDKVSYLDLWSRAGSGGGGSSYSVTTAVNTSNYTVPTGRKVFVYLADLTGQANRNVVLPAATSGDEFVFVNLNTVASGFNWTFTSGTVKDNSQTTITAVANLTTYHIVYGGTNYQIIN